MRWTVPSNLAAQLLMSVENRLAIGRTGSKALAIFATVSSALVAPSASAKTRPILLPHAAAPSRGGRLSVPCAAARPTAGDFSRESWFPACPARVRGLTSPRLSPSNRCAISGLTPIKERAFSNYATKRMSTKSLSNCSSLIELLRILRSFPQLRHGHAARHSDTRKARKNAKRITRLYAKMPYGDFGRQLVERAGPYVSAPLEHDAAVCYLRQFSRRLINQQNRKVLSFP